MSLLCKYLKQVNIKNRKGVITTVKISKNIPICEFNGQIFTENELDNTTNFDTCDALQIGPNTYIGPSGNVVDKIRHSCNPNCYLHVSGARAILYSLCLIKPGSEITYDYSTTSTDSPETWNMKCNCGDFNCRKNISGFYFLPVELQERYKSEEIAALFIRNPIFLRR